MVKSCYKIDAPVKCREKEEHRCIDVVKEDTKGVWVTEEDAKDLHTFWWEQQKVGGRCWYELHTVFLCAYNVFFPHLSWLQLAVIQISIGFMSYVESQLQLQTSGFTRYSCSRHTFQMQISTYFEDRIHVRLGGTLTNAVHNELVFLCFPRQSWCETKSRDF